MNGRTARIALAILAFGTLVPDAQAQQVQYSHGEPTALEQKMLEFINRARMNPTQEGILLDGVNTAYSRDARARKPSFFANLRGEFASYPAVPPLAFHHRLIQASRAHSQDMLTRNFFAHVNPSGQDPTARGAVVGYDSGVGENIAGAGATNGDEVLHGHYGFMVDYDNIDTSHPLGHRLNVLDSSYTEAGVGMAGAYLPGRITQDFGGPSRAYILGVAYTDTNGNGAYDPGEGRSGITVRPDIGNYFAVTSASGGFAIPISPIQTVTDTVNLPFPVQGSSWTAVQPYDRTYRQQQMQAAPALTVNLTWSGGSLTAPRTTTTTIKRPVQRNYRLTGTDGWYYTMSMVTTQNVKADFTSIVGSAPANIPNIPTFKKDLNNDGKADILLQNNAGQIVTWYMNGGGSRANWAWISTDALGDWRLAGTEDFNNDGKSDILLQDTAGRIVVWYMNGAGARTGWAYISTDALGDWRVVGTADCNSDSNADILLQNAAGNIVAWHMNGAGARIGWAWVATWSLGDWRVAGTGDFNSDGRADILLQNTSGQVVAWFMNGAGSRTSWAYVSTDATGDWRVAAAADFNNDGNTDILFQNAAGHVVVWYMNGTGIRTHWAWISTAQLGEWRVR